MFSIRINTDSPEYRDGTVWALTGIGMQLVSQLFMIGEDLLPVAELFLFLAGAGFVIHGLALIARSKSRSPFWGVLGLLSLVGWILVAFLEDRSAEAQALLDRPTAAEP